ncbi:MAG: phytanoyl-CoA dioxygenase, partial [Maribacter sp.]
MTPEDVMAIAPKVLTQAQRESYFADGYLLLEKVLTDEWIERLRQATDEKINESRGIA